MTFKFVNSLPSVKTFSARRIKVEGGDVLHFLNENEEGFSRFGEVYFSLINYKKIKGWKKHKKMSLNLVCPKGKVLFVFTEDFNSFLKIVIGSSNYLRINVLPGTWFAFQGLEKPCSMVSNVTNLKHCPEEVEKLSLSSIDFCWDLK